MNENNLWLCALEILLLDIQDIWVYSEVSVTFSYIVELVSNIYS